MSADIESLRARVAELQARFESYGGGDRPMSPPADLIRSCIAAESALAEAVAAEQRATCLDCRAPYGGDSLDTVLSDEQWRAIHPGESGILCASCIARRASKLPGAVRLAARVEFAPLTASEAAFMSADVGELQRMLAEIPASESANRASLQARLSETQEALSGGVSAGILRPRGGSPAWAAIGEIAAALGLDEDASVQDVIDAVKNERGREWLLRGVVAMLRREHNGRPFSALDSIARLIDGSRSGAGREVKRLLVFGSRQWGEVSRGCGCGLDFDAAGNERFWMLSVLNRIFMGVHMFGRGLCIVEGEARGADKRAREWADKYSVAVDPYPVDHALDGPWPAAGHRRNERMHREGRPDEAIGFISGKVGSPFSRGSAGMAAICRKAGTPLTVYREDGIEVLR